MENNILRFRNTASNLGRIIHILHDKQLLIEADESSLLKLQPHLINRNIDNEWVEKLKLPLMKTIQNKYTFTNFVIAILLDEINIDTEGAESYRVVILDSQHRSRALTKLLEEIPTLKFNIIFEVYLVESDKEIRERIDQINYQQVFKEKDKIDINARANFSDVFYEILGEKMKHKCAKKVLDSHILKDPEFIRRIQDKSQDEIKKRLLELSTEYIPLYENEKLKDPTFDKKVLGKTIIYSKLYQLCDDSLQWLYKF